MTLNLEELPTHIEAVFKEGIVRARGGGALLPPAGGTKIYFTLPHRVFTPRLRALQSVSRLKRLKPDYWQVVLRCPDRKKEKDEFFGSARAAEEYTQKDKWFFTGFNLGDTAVMISEANKALVSKVEIMDEVTDYRVNLLVLTQPRLVAIWAKCKTGGEDFITALPGSDEIWEPDGNMMRLKDFVDIAKDVRERIETDAYIA